MADTFKHEIDEEVQDTSKVFLHKLESEMFFKSNYSGDLMSFEWVDELEKACPHIDIIVRNPKVTLVQIANVEKIEKAKKITVESVKDLARHTNYINRVDSKTNMVEPSKILDIRNEETYNIYENRFLFTLIKLMARFVATKEDELKRFDLTNDKLLEYKGETETRKDKITVELKVTSESLPSNNMSKKLQEEINEIKKRIKRIKEYISSWEKSEMMKALERAHVKEINPPIKKTNIFLKNPNFKIATKLWEYLYKYFFEERDDSKENLKNDGNTILKGFLDHSFLVDYFVLDSIVASKREQKQHMSKYAILMLTEEIRRIVTLLLSCGIKITDEELIRLVAKEIKDSRSQRLVGVEDVKKKFQNALDEYLERTQENL